jgi:hypothetical protein
MGFMVQAPLPDMGIGEIVVGWRYHSIFLSNSVPHEQAIAALLLHSTELIKRWDQAHLGLIK